jgi:hypothetical protein
MRALQLKSPALAEAGDVFEICSCLYDRYTLRSAYLKVLSRCYLKLPEVYLLLTLSVSDSQLSCGCCQYATLFQMTRTGAAET